MFLNRYKDDYKQVQSLGRDGKLHTVTYYEGNYYEFPYDDRKLKRNKISCLLYYILFFITYLGAGSLNAESSRTFWIVFPYLFVFLPLGYFFLGLINLLNIKLKMERAEYEGSIIRIKNSSLAILVLSIINILLDLIFLILNHANINIILELLYICCFIILVATVVMFGKKYDKMFGGVVLNSNQIH